MQHKVHFLSIWALATKIMTIGLKEIPTGSLCMKQIMVSLSHLNTHPVLGFSELYQPHHKL